MSDEHVPATPRPGQEPEWQRRKRLAAVFGDVLPETTRDERDPEAAADDAAQDRWLRSQVPPHHG
ncbi:MAG TPA: hypothetical protein VGK78_03565 [Nocardioides sp.]|uniref:hypothetical protein n=1 Tax=Nocardioides sp. TaxID=35761 RepID=UPI002F414DA5